MSMKENVNMGLSVSEESLEFAKRDDIGLAYSEYGTDHGHTLYVKILNMYESGMKPYKEITEWRKVGLRMMKYMRFCEQAIKAGNKSFKRLKANDFDRSGKRWTKEEDEILIEMMCDDRTSLIDISCALGRTIAAIQTRCSILVGVERTEQKIKGKFAGKLNGMIVDGTIDGLLMK